MGLGFQRQRVSTPAFLGLNCFRVGVGLAGLLTGVPLGVADTATKIAKKRMIT